MTTISGRLGAPALPAAAEPRSFEAEVAAVPRARTLSVLLVVEPGLDGVFRHVEGLVEHLLWEGARVHLAYSSCRSSEALHKLVARVRRSGGCVADLRVSNAPSFRDLRAAWRLAALIRAVRPDVVHAHSSKAGALARAMALVLRRPEYIYTPHAYYGLGKPPWLRVRLFNRVERMLGRIGRTVAISQDEADFAVARLGVPIDRIQVIHNPVDSARFGPPTAEQRKAARECYGIPDDAIVLATVGRMCWQKDPETAYKAVAPLCAENPRLMFLHLGWGKWRPYLLGLARELGCSGQVRIVDYVDDPRSFYHAVDGVLLTSRYEAGWPLVLLEALACNLPVVASTSIGMSDVGAAGLNALWTFPPKDVAACTEVLRAWLATAGNPGRPACNHRGFVLEQLTPERYYGSVMELYRNAPAGTVAAKPCEA